VKSAILCLALSLARAAARGDAAVRTYGLGAALAKVGAAPNLEMLRGRVILDYQLEGGRNVW